MKSFLEELARAHSPYEIDITNTESKLRKKSLREKYTALIGKRALYKNKDKEMRIVTICEATENYVRFSYPHNNVERQGQIYSTANYLALFCGDDRLEVEDDE
ncbi:hypothetical protein EalM132_00131 [Exiguobacterium phage vB_EalM-132]|nr:hypothetical protein EalM132_00131 [Exiguobacterium phage vB_EalM-132]